MNGMNHSAYWWSRGYDAGRRLKEAPAWGDIPATCRDWYEQGHSAGEREHRRLLGVRYTSPREDGGT